MKNFGQRFDFLAHSKDCNWLKNTFYFFFSVTMNQNIRSLNEKHIKNVQFNLKKAIIFTLWDGFLKKRPDEIF
jgi:hypothetical protein